MKWNFAEFNEENMDDVGFIDNDIKKFGKNIAKSIVREAIQNSMDALDSKNGYSQVRVVIRTDKVKKSSLKNFAEIEEHIKKCYEYKANKKAAKEEIKRHIDAFEKEEYTYLEISDYNTTGMTSEDLRTLTSAIFRSNKPSGSQGSEGVGKAAYYASSYLRTMLVSTRNDKNLLYRGASKLSTHQSPDDSNSFLNYKGFYGDFNPKTEENVPNLFWRDEKGSSIFVIGFWEDANLLEKVIIEVLRNYWFSIVKNQLTVKVNDTDINNETIEELLKTHFSDYTDYLTGKKQNPRPYYETLKNGKVYETEIPNIGKCKLWLGKNENFSGYVSRFRKTKMLIYKTRELEPGFAGIFLCDNIEGNEFLKDIENDEHDKWFVNINKNLGDKPKETLDAISEFITKKFVEFSGIDNKDSFSVDILDELLNISFQGKSKHKKGPDKPNREKEKKDTIDRLIKKSKFEFEHKGGKYLYHLDLKSKESVKKQQFKVSIGTDSSKDVVEIINIIQNGSQIEFDGNEFTLDVMKGENPKITIELDSPFLSAPSIISI